MNDIERQIEGDFEEENGGIQEEDNNIKLKLNNYKNDDNKKKIILYVVIGALIVSLLGVIIYLVFNRDNNGNNNTDNPTVNDDNNVTDNIGNNLEEDNTAYVICDENTALLNVRNSTTGDIIDGLSCYKELTIEEELPGTDNCPLWYKISYKKRGSNYTGYSCATYIKKDEISEETKKVVEELIDKANDYYENNYLKAFCGNTSGSKEIEFDDDSEMGKITGNYLKSEYKTLDELKNYLLSFLDEDVFTSKLKLSDINNAKYYDDYYEIDGNLYCRNYSGKGWLTYYTDNYDYEIVSVSDNKISVNIAYEYLNEENLYGEKCNLNNLSSCSNANFNYELGKVVIEKIDGNYIITRMDFHK
ncbi:MAG: hypothetical protein IJZ46_01695 [Bacilli bacterium]|nr:hypothetical protein [Bacilli bacterium]